MEKRIAAYAYFFIAGMTSACMGISWFLGISFIDAIFFHQGRVSLLPETIIAGIAAVIGAWAVHKPFLREARIQRRGRMWQWVVLGVIASHVIYVVLISFNEIYSSGTLYIDRHADYALVIGFFSVVLGLVPNTLFGICFAETLLWQGKNGGVASSQADAQQNDV